MTEVTIVLLDGTFSSTADGPMEVFRHAGTLWGFLTGTRQVPRFRVTTASVDGGTVRCDGGIQIQPDVALTSIRNTSLIFIPTTGLSLDDASSAMRRFCPGCGAGTSAELPLLACVQAWV